MMQIVVMYVLCIRVSVCYKISEAPCLYWLVFKCVCMYASMSVV